MKGFEITIHFDFKRIRWRHISAAPNRRLSYRAFAIFQPNTFNRPATALRQIELEVLERDLDVSRKVSIRPLKLSGPSTNSQSVILIG
jgi:hypothetical protein